MKTIKKIEQIVEGVMELDQFGTDYKITKNEFDKVANNKKLIELLTGEKKEIKEWSDFKEPFISFQESFGFFWRKTQGKYGTLTLESIQILPIVGEELATELINNKTPKGHFLDENGLKKYLPSLTKYLDKHNFDFSSYDFSGAKNSFSETVINNQRYKFSGRSYSFELGIEQYTYQGKTRNREFELGEALLEDNKLKNLLNLDFIPHQQEKRKLKKYQNVDFEGFKLIRKINGDELEIINIELKPSNKIEYVSDAISQAVNYKESANRTYIAVPLFDPRNFYDSERFQTFVKLCEENELGIISINIDINEDKEGKAKHKVTGLDIILQAPKRELVKHERAIELLEEDGKVHCPLCNKIVDYDRNRCGWLVTVGEDSNCMKEIMESSLITQKS